MDKSIGIGIMVGVFISIGFLIYELKKKAKDRYVNKDLYKARKEADEIDDKLEKLSDLYNDGYLTQDEFNQKSAKLKADKTKKEVEQTDEYKKLKDLYDDGILTKEEFESKIDSLSKKETIKQERKDKFNFNIADKISEELYLITDTEINYGFADADYKVVIEPKYEYAESFSYGLALVRINGKFGFIDKNDCLVIDCKYDYAESFKYGTSLVKINNFKHVINKKGERV